MKLGDDEYPRIKKEFDVVVNSLKPLNLIDQTRIIRLITNLCIDLCGTQTFVKWANEVSMSKEYQQLERDNPQGLPWAQEIENEHSNSN